MTECCTRRFLWQIAKYSHGREESKRRQNPQIRLIKYLFDVKYGIRKSLYSYRRFRRLLLTALPH